MKLYWCPGTRAARALWLLEEAGLDYQRVLIDIRNPESIDDEDFYTASPMGKVPALIDGEVKLADSAAVALYIADRYPDAGLAPAIEHKDRGRYLYWMVYTPGVIEPAMAEKFGGWETSRATHGWGDFDSMVTTLERGLEEGPWLLGENFSAADVLVGSTLNFLKLFGIMPDSAILREYLERCLARPAYRKALEIDGTGAG